MPKQVELFYFEGCPSWEQALHNLEEALRLEGLMLPVSRMLITSAEDAQAQRFLGSPTIRVDGEDVEGSAAKEQAFALTCRLYREGTQVAGWPSVTVIRRALQG